MKGRVSKNITTFALTTTYHIAYTQSLPAVKSEGFFQKNLKSFELKKIAKNVFRL